MSFFVTVQFVGDDKRAQRVLDEHPEIAAAVADALSRNGLIRSTRFVGDGEYLDLDEWPARANREAFLAEVSPQLRRWMELAGVTFTSSTWRAATRDEDF